jgi:AcrR family transcriptional regulator
VRPEQVLDVAEQLFGDNGYHVTTIEEIAAGSELTVGALHTMFEGKAEVLAAVLKRRCVEMRVELQAIRAESRPGLDEVLALSAFYIGYYAALPALGRLHLRAYPSAGERSPELAGYGPSAAATKYLFIEAIERGQREGAIRPGRPLWLAAMVQSLIMFDHSLRYSAEPTATRDDLLSVIRSAVEAPPAS